VKKTQVLRKLNFKEEIIPEQKLKLITKQQATIQKPYNEDFFSNFETFHVADDYSEDIISYLQERDVITINSMCFPF